MTVVEQEKMLGEKAQLIDELHHDLEAAQSALKVKDTEVKEATDKLEECLQKLRESRDKIKENGNGQSLVVSILPPHLSRLVLVSV